MLRKLFTRIALVLGLCLGWLGLGELYDAFRFVPRDLVVKHRTILRQLKQAPTVLFLGDSHFAFGIRNSQLPRGWINLSYPGDKYGDVLLKLEFLKSKGLLPNLLALQVDPHKWAVTYGHLNGANYLPLLPIQQVADIANWSLAEKGWNSLYMHLAVASPSFREELLRMMAHDLTATIQGQSLRQLIRLDSMNDWQTSESGKWAVLGASERMQAANQKVEIHFGGGGLDSVNVRYLQRIIAFCAANQIEVIGIQTPVTPLYREKRKPLMFGFPIQPVPFPILDFTDSLSALDHCFSDPNHLNVVGSRVFTPIVVRQLQRVTPQ